MKVHQCVLAPAGRLGVAVALVVLLLAGCRSAPGTGSTLPSRDRAPQTVLIWPIMDMAAVYGEQVSAKCPVSGSVFKTAGRVPPATLEVLEKQLIDSLNGIEGLSVLPPGQARGVVSGLMEKNPQGLPPKLEMLEAARSAGADAVLSTMVYRFRQRVGNAYGVDRPASLAMGLFLLGSPGGERLWSARFDETQRSLFEDLFQFDSFVKRKGVWVTADEMAVGALSDMMSRFPAR